MTLPFVQLSPDNIVVGLSCELVAMLSTLYPSGIYSQSCI